MTRKRRSSAPQRWRRWSSWPCSAAPLRSRPPIPERRIVAGPTVQIHGDKAAQFLPLGVGKSIVVDLPGDIKDVLVADPKIANAVVRTSRRAYIIGVAIGQTNVYFFDSEGRQLMGFDIAVTRDLNGIRAGLKRALPGSRHRGRGACRRHHAHRLGRDPDRSAAGLRSRRAPGRRRRQGGQRHLGARPRPGDAQGHRRRGAARRHQAARHRSERHAEQRPERCSISATSTRSRCSVSAAEQQRHHRELPRRHRDAARDGACRRDPHAGRAEPDRDLR